VQRQMEKGANQPSC